MASNNESCDAPTKEIDIYRDTPLRLLGYANEVGEAFRALVSVKFVILLTVINLQVFVCTSN